MGADLLSRPAGRDDYLVADRVHQVQSVAADAVRVAPFTVGASAVVSRTLIVSSPPDSFTDIEQGPGACRVALVTSSLTTSSASMPR